MCRIADVLAREILDSEAILRWKWIFTWKMEL